MTTQTPTEKRRKHEHNGREYLCYPDGRCWFCNRVVTMEEDMPAPDSPSTETIDLGSFSGWDAIYPSSLQPTLDDLLFTRYKVETVKVSISGTIEMPLEALRQFEAGLNPGDRVAISCAGHVADLSAPYALKDDSHQGRVVLRVETVTGFSKLGASA